MRCFAFALACLLAPIVLLAQVGTQASFFGTVNDASGAVVPNAEVTVMNLDTGLTKTVRSDTEGSFNVLALPIGSYSVSVKAAGFKTWELPKSELTVGGRSRISPILQVGTASETVSVSGSSELIQTEKSSVETVVQMQQIRELPLATRNPLALVATVPGMRWESTQNGGERATYVQGQGLRNNKTAFQLDGLNSNAPMDEGGTAMPNVDTIAEFSVENNSFSAESGRDPMQVRVVTKSGTNNYHGAAWEFLQNDAFNARNTFAVQPPRVRRNQFGGAVGGPVFKNKTFFFGSFEGTLIHNQTVYNSQAVTSAMKSGDFSALSKTIRNPYDNGNPFPGNRIPAYMLSGASQNLNPWVLEANSADGRYRDNAGSINDTYEGTGRVDHQITDAQRIYVRYVQIRQPQNALGYRPDLIDSNNVIQHNFGVNYTWTASPSTVVSASAGRMSTDQKYGYGSDLFGKQNYTQLAGIQGFPTAGREQWIGVPQLDFSASGYTGVSMPGGWGVPGHLWGSVYNGKLSVDHVHLNHTFGAGVEYGRWRAWQSHGGNATRGIFQFNNLYTNDSFADYLLGLASYSERSYPLRLFGDTDPYAAAYVQDAWRVRPNLTLSLGLRYERWAARTNANDGSSTWDSKLGKYVAAVQTDGNINYNAYGVTPYLAAATQGLWVTAKQANYPDNLWLANSGWAPRLGVTYRPFSRKMFVVRAGYGLFYNSYTGNRAGSTVNLPYWANESIAYGRSTLHRYEGIWSNDPSAFGVLTSYSPIQSIKPARNHEWNVSLQTPLPFRSALTVSYVGTRVSNEIGERNYNDAPIGPHTDLQADRPYAKIGAINSIENLGANWHNAFQTRLERRFAQGLSFTLSYAFSRSMYDGTPECDTCVLLSYSPKWYNRGREPFDFRHIEYATVVWEAPVGRGRRYFSGMNRSVDALLGGWQLAVTQQGTSGAPLTVFAGGTTLGNGNGTRANLTGKPGMANPSVNQWFNTNAFATPALYTFGNSGVGIIEAPGLFVINASLSKSFHITENKYFQLRWENFNATNRVNYNGPSTTITSTNFGRITSAGNPRQMQFGLKFLF